MGSLNFIPKVTSKAGCFLALPFALLFSSAVEAKPVDPIGLYSEAKVLESAPSGTAPTVAPTNTAVGVTAPTGTAATKPVTAKTTVPGAPQNKAKELATKVRNWVTDKWNQWRGVAPSAAPTNVAKPTGSPQRQPTQVAPVASAPQGAANTTSPSVVPSAPAAVTVAPVAAPASGMPIPSQGIDNRPRLSDLPKSESGVRVYTLLPEVDKIPLLDVGREERVSADRWQLDTMRNAMFEKMVVREKDSPPLLTPVRMKALKTAWTKPAAPALNPRTVFFQPKGKVSREAFDQITLIRKPENPLALKKIVPLTEDELRFLSGLLLYQQGDKCAVAIGLFYQLSKSKSYTAEGNYYLAMCSKKLGMLTDFIERARRVVETQDIYYTKKILPDVSPDLPYEFIEPFGKVLLTTAAAKKLPDFDNSELAGNVYYILANYGAQTGNFKVAHAYGQMVPVTHPKWPQAQFLIALGYYQTGSKTQALGIQEDLVEKLNIDKTKAEFQALVAMNLARMYFQEKNFKASRDWFLKVYKDHPLWLQGLQEMGWSQLQMGDYEGAIGNMYSVQSPYFSSVYKPESYVIRSIGYLNLCQYGDAYRTLTTLERQYRPWLEKMNAYQQTPPDYIGTVRKFIQMKSASVDIDGLPSQVIREMVRHRDYIHLQTSLNRQIDERAYYAGLDGEVEKSLKRARWLVNNSRKRADILRAKLASIKRNPQMEQNRLVWKAELDKELDLLNGYFFEIDVFNEAQASLRAYKSEVVAGAEKRIELMRSRIIVVLDQRLKRMRGDLARILDNNELLRYEVFAGSGENIRYQVAGGESGNRVAADVRPKSKTLQWDFDGEYWEDEIGHYRSSLKNNCPDSEKQEHASL